MKWTNQSTRPVLAKKAIKAINALETERYKSEEIITGGHRMIVCKFGVYREEKASNEKAVELYQGLGDNYRWTITDENVKAITGVAQELLKEAEKARTVIDRQAVPA